MSDPLKHALLHVRLVILTTVVTFNLWHLIHLWIESANSEGEGEGESAPVRTLARAFAVLTYAISVFECALFFISITCTLVVKVHK